MRPSADETWLDVARAVARRSTCLRRAVGCALVDARGELISTGYNGVAPGQPHCNELVEYALVGGEIEPRYPHACPGAAARSGERLDDCAAIHAEQNACLSARRPFEIETCYVTTAPCVPCVKLLLRSTCRRIVYLEEYGASGQALWEDAGRAWERFVVSDRT